MRLIITEREPVFLKDKGDAFFRAGNYRSALEAYTAALDSRPLFRLFWDELKLLRHELRQRLPRHKAVAVEVCTCAVRIPCAQVRRPSVSVGMGGRVFLFRSV